MSTLNQCTKVTAAIALLLMANTAIAQINLGNRLSRVVDKGLDKIEERVTKTKTVDNENANDAKSTGGHFVNATKLSLPPAKLIFANDFKNTNKGSFPSNWNTNTGGEITTIYGSQDNWLQLSKRGVYFPEDFNILPENFILQFEFFVSENFFLNGTGIQTVFVKSLKNRLGYNQGSGASNQTVVDIHPWAKNLMTNYAIIDGVGGKTENENNLERASNDPISVTIIKQGSQMKVYTDNDKIWDLPRAFQPEMQYSLLFANDISEGALYIANVRISEVQ